MPDLAAHQRAFARALRGAGDANGDADNDARGDPLAHRFTTDAATSARRIAIYRGNSIAAATKALAGAYPVIREVVGEEFFDDLARAYWTVTPSHSGDLGDYGEQFAGFLADFEHVRELPYLADVARLEWAVQRAECAADAPPFDAATLAAVPDDRQAALIFELVAGTAIVASRYPIARIWNLHRGEGARIDAPLSEASTTNGFAIDWSIGETALVSRKGYAVRVVALDPGSAAALPAMLSGATLVDALAAGLAAAMAAHATFDMAGAPAAWLLDGLFTGFQFSDVPMENADVHHP